MKKKAKVQRIKTSIKTYRSKKCNILIPSALKTVKTLIELSSIKLKRKVLFLISPIKLYITQLLEKVEKYDGTREKLTQKSSLRTFKRD